jgi:hypothetical protein
MMNESETGREQVGIGSELPPGTAPPPPSWRALLTDAIRYWEPRRFIYNAVLALIVLGYFLAQWPGSRRACTFDGLLCLFALAVLANLCYCAAYVADIFVQFSGFQTLWIRWRWVLLALGITFAAIIARFVVLGFFSGDHVG